MICRGVSPKLFERECQASEINEVLRKKRFKSMNVPFPSYLLPRRGASELYHLYPFSLLASLPLLTQSFLPSMFALSQQPAIETCRQPERVVEQLERAIKAFEESRGALLECRFAHRFESH